jgi:4-amino-4-deoxy-L-arabinose transferase-like glycosyltransferase
LSRSWLILPLLILFLLDLGGTGFLGPDEPRYASIGREMARSHDFVTPHLDGQAWFEKPPLLYWTTAVGLLLRLPDEWGARLPVALMSIAFLLFFLQVLMREFSPRVALAATTILATSAGWLAYSFAAVPDMPMTTALAAAMMIALFDTRRDQGYVAGVLLGLAVLAKGFVPLVLFAPLFLIMRGKRLTTMIGCIVVAAPWYLLVGERNGSIFWQEFFWKHHVQRFLSPVLEHVQPFWYYVPVILAGLFPWIPLAGLLFRRKTFEDVRVRSLALWLVYALLFFSVSRNKLPGYILPLMPALAIVLAAGLEKAGDSLKWWLTASTVMLVALPVIAAILPTALLLGLRHAQLSFTPGLPFLLIAPVVWWLASRGKPNLAMVAIGMGIVLGVAYVKGATFRELDERVSARQFWRAHRDEIESACIGNDVRRDWEYELNYYGSRVLAHCDDGKSKWPVRISGRDGKLAVVRRPQ